MGNLPSRMTDPSGCEKVGKKILPEVLLLIHMMRYILCGQLSNLLLFDDDLHLHVLK